ncbi:MAG: hypothetical protein ACW98D_07765 [Promethearchaeota archaeon]|jgi:hypothetical protein
MEDGLLVVYKKKLGDYIAKDALKFFQAYIREMIDVGGSNLPKAISSKSGAKLGKVYKEKRLASKIEDALKQIYIALKAKPIVKKLNDNQYEVIVKYSKGFCSIGGSDHSSQSHIFQESICIPYTKGFLNELFPQYKFEADIINCIPLNGHKTCHYMLKVSDRQNST